MQKTNDKRRTTTIVVTHLPGGLFPIVSGVTDPDVFKALSSFVTSVKFDVEKKLPARFRDQGRQLRERAIREVLATKEQKLLDALSKLERHDDDAD